MARVDTNTGEMIFETQDKRFEAQPAYLMSIFQQINRLGDIVVNNEKGYGNPNIDIHTKFIIALIIDPVLRDEIKEYRKDRIVSELTEDMSADDRNKVMFDINMDTLGECMCAYDNFLGIVKKQEIMRTGSPRIKELEIKALAEREANE